MQFLCDLRKLVALCTVIAACGGKTKGPSDTPPVDAAGGQGGSGGASGSGGGMCVVPDPGPPAFEGGPPASYGCAAKREGVWEELPCSCELWLRNPGTIPLETGIHFAFSPTDLTPSLDDQPLAELHVPDPDGAFERTWSSQAGAGTAFTVTAADGTTTLRLGVSELALDPVTLPGCERSTATATVKGPWGTRLVLSVSAAFSDFSGTAVGSSMGECEQPASHPTPAQPDAGAGAGGPPQ